jgi:hypothetical protein
MKIRKPTECRRVTCSQELELKLDSEAGSVEGTYRRVTLIIPSSPKFHFSFDTPTPNIAGPNRDFYVPDFSGPLSIVFCLAPAQKLYGQVDQGEGMGFATMIIEYLED